MTPQKRSFATSSATAGTLPLESNAMILSEQESVSSEPISRKSNRVMQINKIYADPTIDIGFKMLLTQDKEVLISIVNSLLGFVGDNEIVELELGPTENPVGVISDEKGQTGIVSSVDIICINRGKHKIAIEMQGQREKYFLAREQSYMAKLIANQVKEGEGKLYHEAILETYIIVIGKDNMFAGRTALKEKERFEIDVKPMVVQTGEIYPDNKMNWKFFELPKFKQSANYKTISEDSDIKDQWLEFLINCEKQETEPERKEIIKKGYRIMEIAKWSELKQDLYWKQKQNEEAALQRIKESNEESFSRGEMRGEIKGKLNGEIKGEIKEIKSFLEFEISRERFVPKLKFLTNEKIVGKLDENLKYIEQHEVYDGYESDICKELGLCDMLLAENDDLS